MKRLMIAGAAVLAVTGLAVAGCGTAHANAPAASGGKSGALASAHLPKGYLPELTAQQVAAGHLVSRPWTLVSTSHGVAQIKYSYGGCTPRPTGVLVTRSGAAITMSLEAPRLKAGTVCAPNLVVATARVSLPGLAGNSLQHAPAHS
jgi:hypothetical protein